MSDQIVFHGMFTMHCSFLITLRAAMTIVQTIFLALLFIGGEYALDLLNSPVRVGEAYILPEF